MIKLIKKGAIMEQRTELQWAKRGFVPNEDAKGEEGWNNNYCKLPIKSPYKL